MQCAESAVIPAVRGMSRRSSECSPAAVSMTATISVPPEASFTQDVSGTHKSSTPCRLSGKTYRWRWAALAVLLVAEAMNLAEQHQHGDPAGATAGSGRRGAVEAKPE
jgi:hypothetical protein